MKVAEFVIYFVTKNEQSATVICFESFKSVK